ncbi:unnamed protein product, partial [Didymodactylos carnosus]
PATGRNATSPKEDEAQLLAASTEWIRRFNMADFKYVVDTYLPTAKLYARNAGAASLPLIGREQIGKFWNNFYKETNATNLIYYDRKIVITGPGRGESSSRWTMNVDDGFIDRETWVRNSETGIWSIAFDDFTVEQSYISGFELTMNI